MSLILPEMGQNIEKSFVKKIQKKTSEPIQTYKTKLVTDVHNILHPRFHHKYVPVNKSSINTIHLSELQSLYAFLTNEIIEFKKIFHRPECPVKSPIQKTLARYEYKNAMVKYISNFGHELKNHPCTYSPAFLEAFANYCEDKIR